MMQEDSCRNYTTNDTADRTDIEKSAVLKIEILYTLAIQKYIVLFQ